MTDKKNKIHPSSLKEIRIRGARQNNLKNVDINIPLNRLVVVSGLSGTGKSSLVFDTLHAEGNRRYVETFSSYTRQFLEKLDKPDVDEIQNIHPSIAIEQGNTVKTSRSTIGTMTELCDYFKVWFSYTAELFDPESGEKITQDDPSTVYQKLSETFPGETKLIAFEIDVPDNLKLEEILQSLSKQGFTRIILKGVITRIEDVKISRGGEKNKLIVIQDRLKINKASMKRGLEAIKSAFHFGRGDILVLDPEGNEQSRYSEGLRKPGSSKRYQKATPNLFSFNSPLGACPECRGFGRVIKLDDRLVIPDESLSIRDGAIKAFSGAVYSESQRDLMAACERTHVPTDIPWRKLKKKDRQFVLEGESGYGKGENKWPKAWYGVYRFFDWLEENTYKMHVRVFLSRYRAYVPCPKCGGTRLKEESLCWKWMGYRLPDLYQLPISELLNLLKKKSKLTGNRQFDNALTSILNRLGYLNSIGLGYLTLDRSSRSLSGGETQRVNLTACLGTSLVETLFILDEPSIGLHARDIDKLISVLKDLVHKGNTVVVVEHDEAVICAADHVIEMGPQPGADGGRVFFSGTVAKLKKKHDSPTGRFLSGKESIEIPDSVRTVTSRNKRLKLLGVEKHNLNNVNVDFPLNRFVALTGVSGSGKSTLLHNAIYQGLLSEQGKAVTDPATIKRIQTGNKIDEVILVDQSAFSKTPRSNPALITKAWDRIRQKFAKSESAMAKGFTASSFSFNSEEGRCPACKGIGYEVVEMQFMANLYVRCETCGGKRFKKTVLETELNGKSPDQILGLSVSEAIDFFKDDHIISSRLKPLEEVGLGYLSLGQPLNTLSGGESQRLKLVRFLNKVSGEKSHNLILLDEPTTGLHRQDVKVLISVLQKLVAAGNSLIVIEHQMDVIKSADWVVEMGPESGMSGGKVVFEGTPKELSKSKTQTAAHLISSTKVSGRTPLKAASKKGMIRLQGAREHNLKNLNVDIPHNKISVLTGVSGSGKSTLAFDIIFSESQRRFMESMSSWARQYVEQLPKPDIDSLEGLSPSIAIEQRLTRGTRKSTVATITEVAQYLRLLFVRVGIVYSKHTGEPLERIEASAIPELLKAYIRKQAKPKKNAPKTFNILSPLIRGRKGHHEPLANWALKNGYQQFYADRKWIQLSQFQKLDRYKEHDIDLLLGDISINTQGDLSTSSQKDQTFEELIDDALKRGNGRFYLSETDKPEEKKWFSTINADPVTGESIPELEPKHFSWNSPRGWCPHCHGHGERYEWMEEDESYEPSHPVPNKFPVKCPVCNGSRLNELAQSVYVLTQEGKKWNLPELLSLTPDHLIKILQSLHLDARGRAILKELLPPILERMAFMNAVGLGYLELDRATITLSGGEAQRIRLAAHLGSNLSGTLFVMDEPSIGLHARDSRKLIKAISSLKDKGNTVVVVEHDLEMMKAADRIYDLGPSAGKRGGELMAIGTADELKKHPDSLTGRALVSECLETIPNKRRPLPKKFSNRSKKSGQDWFAIRNVRLRNLKGDDLVLPKNRFIGVCGISGGGKSTLVRDLLKPAVEKAIKENSARLTDTNDSLYKDCLFANEFQKVIEVDQSPIGKTPRSTPATYIGAFDLIRKLFAMSQEAKIRALTPGAFSFNSKLGYCKTCSGAGQIKLEMNFMPDTYVPCHECNGQRYSPEILEVFWKGKNIAQILNMSFEEAADFFAFDSRLSAMLSLMVETGLGYLSLGQPSPTLSGGEAQRLKLVSELVKGLPSFKAKKSGLSNSNLYILEEPTIGLHQEDIVKLIKLLQKLVDDGHTVIVIEHQLNVLASVDYLVEIGPEGGPSGGQILFQDVPEAMLNLNESPTKNHIRAFLTKGFMPHAPT